MKNNIKLLCDSMREKMLTDKLEYFEVKQIGDLEHDYKNQCKAALMAYRQWQRDYYIQTDIIELLYGQIQGVIFRRHAENAIQGYWLIRNEYRRVFQNYLKKNSAYFSNITTSKAA